MPPSDAAQESPHGRRRSPAPLLLTVAVLVAVAGAAAVAVRTFTRDVTDSPEGVATAWVEAMMAADCDDWLRLSTPASRQFVSAAGCPLSPTEGRVAGATERQRRANAAIVDVDVAGGRLAGEDVAVLVVRSDDGGPWLVDLTAATACASPDGEVPDDDDCEPLSLPEDTP